MPAGEETWCIPSVFQCNVGLRALSQGPLFTRHIVAASLSARRGCVCVLVFLSALTQQRQLNLLIECCTGIGIGTCSD